LGLEPEGAEHRTIRLPAPTRNIDALLALIHLELESKPPRAAVVSFITITHPDRPRRGQLTLFGAPEIHPDKLAGSLAHLAARLGPDRVGSPRTVDGYLPERYENVPFEPPAAPKIRQPPRQGRGLLAVRVLRPPVPIEVITEENNFGFRISDFEFAAHPPGTRDACPTNEGSRESLVGQPSRLPAEDSELASRHPDTSDEDEGKIRNSKSEIRNQIPSLRLISVASETGARPRIQGLVRVAAGPWSLEEGWWNDKPVERDYWDLELSGGGLYRVYRDRTTGDWFADGMYD